MRNSKIINLGLSNPIFRKGDIVKTYSDSSEFIVLDRSINQKETITISLYKYKKYRFKWMQRIWNWVINFRYKHGLL